MVNMMNSMQPIEDTSVDTQATDASVLAQDAITPPNTGQSTYLPISHARLRAAFWVAVMADSAGVPLGEFGVVVFDAIVAVVLAAIIGFRPKIWLLLFIALVVEAVPVLGILPTWIGVIEWIVSMDRKSRLTTAESSQAAN
jgi:hypothetical protein